ncbi:MAG TPA: hypothetical protein VGM65_14555 [Candidatus Udaeobacter sp.]|jgi:hypothetical protein
MKKILLITQLLMASIAVAAVNTSSSGIDIEDPPGMQSVVTQENGVTHIRFVPKPAASSATIPSKSTPTVSSEAESALPTNSSSTSPAIDTAVSKVNLDLPISAVPAFMALDLSPETVSNPSTPRDFAAALLNGVDRGGVLNTGVAIEATPFRWIPNVRTDIKAYSENYWNRLLYNFSFSLATAKASNSDSDAVRLALGFSALLYQNAESDPRRSTELKNAFHQVNESYQMSGISPGTPAAEIEDENPMAQKALQQAVKDFRNRSWEGTIWSAAIAPTWSSESGQISDLGNSGFTAWTTVAYGPPGKFFGDMLHCQLAGQLRYRENEHVVDSADSTHTADQNTFIAAGKLRLGITDFNGFAEGAYVKVWKGLNGDESGWRGAFGVEKKISENMWLVLSAGEQFGAATAAGSNELFAVGSFRIGTSQNAEYPAATNAER